MRNIVVFSALLLISMLASGHAQQTVAGNSRAFSILKAVVHRYQVAKGVKCKIERTVTISMLDQTKKSDGEISLSKGRVRVDLKSPDPTTIVFDRSIVWVMTPTPKELGGGSQVLKMRSAALDRESQAPIALFLGDEHVWDQFKIKFEKQAGNELTVDLEKKKKSAEGVQSIELRVNSQKKEIDDLSYTDDLENETEFKFSHTDFAVNLPGSVFNFVPPKNAEVTVVN